MGENLGIIIDRYKELLDQKEETTAILKTISKAIEETKQEVLNAMVDSEMDSVSRGGFSYTLTAKTKYSKKAGNDEAFFEVLRNVGLGDLIHETVNAQSLQGAMTNLTAENDGELPEEIKEVVNVYDFMDISKRKTTK